MKQAEIVIRPLTQKDGTEFARGFAEQGWDSREKLFQQYLYEQEQGRRRIFVAELEGHAAGYVTLLPEAEAGPFAGSGFPEICDFNVLEKYQRHGIGKRLLDAAEKAAAESAETVTLGVGLHQGYGPAQRLYVKRGYIPDGSGVWYQNRRLKPYTPCMNSDDLVLYFSKRLSV